MANELTLAGLTIAFTKTNAPSVNLAPASLSVSVAGTLTSDTVVAVTTAEIAIPIGSVPTGGYMFALNLDPTNFVHIRAATGSTNFIKMLPGEWCMFRCSATAAAPFAIADTATCNVRFLRFSL